MEKRVLLLLKTVLLWFLPTFGQNDENSKQPIPTSLNFLSIVPDARSSGMGLTGVATSPDAFSAYWNPGKLSFSKDEYAASVSYSPWLSKLVNGVGLAAFSGFKRVGEYTVMGIDIRYFSLGKIDFKDEVGYDIYSYSPNEYSLGISYSMQLSEYIGFGATLRYIRSQPALGVEIEGQAVRTANAVGGDIGYYYCNVPISSQESLIENLFRFGASITNIGSKVSYYPGSEKSFQPMNLRLGAAYTFASEMSESYFTLSAELNKLLVPTPPEYDASGNISRGKDPNVSVPSAIISSFFDAPGGMGEELSEFGFGVGGEYAYKSQFFLRTGAFYENPKKSSRQLATFGIGYQGQNFHIDMSYFAPLTNANQNQLGQTFKIAIGVNLVRQ